MGEGGGEGSRVVVFCVYYVWAGEKERVLVRFGFYSLACFMGMRAGGLGSGVGRAGGGGKAWICAVHGTRLQRAVLVVSPPL